MSERSERTIGTVRRRERLGGSGVAVSALGLGTAMLGNLYRAIDDDAATETVAAACACGVSYFDTAPHYGLGLAERRLGEAIAGRDDPDGLVVSTKVGRLLEPSPDPHPGDDLDAGFAVPADLVRHWDFTRRGVLDSLESSRRRLGRERVDIAFLHDPDDHMAAALDEALPALVELRDAGVVGAIGAGMNHTAPLARFVATGVVDVVLLAGRYTLLEQGALDDVLPLALARGASVVIGGVFNSGILTSDAVAPGSRYDYGAAPPAIVDRARRIAAVCRRHDTTLPAAALQFAAAHPAVASVLVGAGSAAEMGQAAEWLATPIPDDLWPALVASGLLRPDAPTPPTGP